MVLFDLMHFPSLSISWIHGVITSDHWRFFLKNSSGTTAQLPSRFILTLFECGILFFHRRDYFLKRLIISVRFSTFPFEFLVEFLPPFLLYLQPDCFLGMHKDSSDQFLHQILQEFNGFRQNSRETTLQWNIYQVLSFLYSLYFLF